MPDSPQLNYFGLFAAVFANQIGLPVPSVFFLMAAGALTANGQMRVSYIVLLSVIACLAADGIWFWFGRRWGTEAIRVICRVMPDPRAAYESSHETFRRYGLFVLLANKFVPGLDAIMPPLVGAEGVSVPTFVALDASGSLVWSIGYVTLGSVFSDQLDMALRWGKHFGTTLGIVLALAIAIYVGRRGVALVQMIRRLRVRRIRPAMLDCKLKSKKKVAVLDLLEFEYHAGQNPAAIPGAMRVNPSRLRHTPRIAIPEDVDVVLYSSSGSDIVCARAALGLKKIGIHDVWVLEGGLKSWLAQGFPVSQVLESHEAVAGRLGVKLPAEEVAR